MINIDEQYRLTGQENASAAGQSPVAHTPPPPAGGADVEFDSLFEGLPRGLVLDLAKLYAAPVAAVDAILQALPFGYRAALEGLGYLSAETEDGPVSLTVKGRLLLGQAYQFANRDVDQAESIHKLRNDLRTAVEKIQERTS